MGQQDPVLESKRFGKFLRKVRESKKLSLDTVEEMSIDFPDRLTKSHLSRIENGLSEPNFRKLFALSQIYGVPLTSLAEEYELDLRRQLVTVDLSGRTGEAIRDEVKVFLEAGRYGEALVLLAAAVDKPEAWSSGMKDEERAHWITDFKLGVLNCLSHLGRFEKAKLEAEAILGHKSLTNDQRLRALQTFVDCCYRLSRFTVALMGLDRAEVELKASDVSPRHRADFAVHRGNLMMATARPAEAIEPYTRALEIYEQIPNPFEACRVRVNIAEALVLADDHAHARRQAEAALLVAEASGYDRLAALAMSHLGVISFKADDLKAAQSWVIRSNAIARSREYALLVFRNCYYLLLIARAKGDQAAVKTNESTLRAYLSRIEENLPEVDAFRAELVGEES